MELKKTELVTIEFRFWNMNLRTWTLSIQPMQAWKLESTTSNSRRFKAYNFTDNPYWETTHPIFKHLQNYLISICQNKLLYWFAISFKYGH